MPGILDLTTQDCVTCKAAQLPALRALEQRLEGKIQVIEVDALDSPDLARRWSVLSVPATFILDRDGRPRHVNHGFASTERLMGQLLSAARRTEAAEHRLQSTDSGTIVAERRLQKAGHGGILQIW